MNTNTNSRVKLTIQLQDVKNSYKFAFKENGEKVIIGYAKMCRKDANGDPDCKNPKIPPVLWDEKELIN